MSIAVTERTRTSPTAIALTVKLATGLLIASAAFLVLFAIHAAVLTPETATALVQ